MIKREEEYPGNFPTRKGEGGLNMEINGFASQIPHFYKIIPFLFSYSLLIVDQ